jgi:hypothetical protein
MHIDKFTVIIPTMWYSDKIERSLIELEECKEVDEIIIIDNNTKLKPTYLNTITKLKYLPQDSNIFVNPAWNLGVEESKNKYICIANDDIVFNTDIFTFIRSYIHTGIYGMWTGNYYKENIELPYEVEVAIDRNWGWGCLLFLHKDNWVPIDSRLRIACGDDFLIKFVKGGAFKIKNMDIEYKTISVTSTRYEFFNIQQQDIQIWSQY